MKRTLFSALSALLLGLMTLMPTAAAADEYHGQFHGLSNHVTTGGVTVVEMTDGSAVVILDSDFSLDGAPDARVGLGNDGTYVPATDLGDLGPLTGMHIFVVPASIDVSDFNEVYIWCRQFAVPLGVASIS
ncbi:MAG: DM13 domain-containing protein [Pseudomonadota bacterium]